jgi:hypothetical protein
MLRCSSGPNGGLQPGPSSQSFLALRRLQCSESLGEIRLNYVKICKSNIFVFFQSKTARLCVFPFPSKVLAHTQASQFYKSKLFSDYSQIPARSEVINCHCSSDNVMASGEDVLQSYEALMNWPLANKNRIFRQTSTQRQHFLYYKSYMGYHESETLASG